MSSKFASFSWEHPFWCPVFAHRAWRTMEEIAWALQSSDANSTACYLMGQFVYEYIIHSHKRSFQGRSLQNSESQYMEQQLVEGETCVYCLFSFFHRLSTLLGTQQAQQTPWRVIGKEQRHKSNHPKTVSSRDAISHYLIKYHRWLLFLPHFSYAAWKQLYYNAVGKFSNLLGVDKQTLKSFTNDVPNLCGICSL